LAGIVEWAAVDGSGPAVGTRVVGFVPSGSWAELVAVPTNALAVLPETVSFAQAATLPVAGLTALHAVERGTSLLAHKVLVTGASGGVGLFACQLAHLSGARVVALYRNAEYTPIVKTCGVEQVIVSEDAEDARSAGPYRLVVESVGGQVLAKTMGMLAPDGVCVSFGSTTSADVTFNLWSLASVGRASLYGLVLFNELARESAAAGLGRLVHLMGTHQLQTYVTIETPWTQIQSVVQQMLDRRFAGKAVLHVTM